MPKALKELTPITDKVKLNKIMQELFMPTFVADFINVIEAGSFTSATEVSNKTQPALSYNVSTLEEMLGQRLVVRCTPCVPTPFGILFLKYIDKFQTTLTRNLYDFGSLTCAENYRFEQLPEERQREVLHRMIGNPDSRISEILKTMRFTHKGERTQ